jgi:hypothetical protein
LACPLPVSSVFKAVDVPEPINNEQYIQNRKVQKDFESLSKQKFFVFFSRSREAKLMVPYELEKALKKVLVLS